jgi:hypothetical protein
LQIVLKGNPPLEFSTPPFGIRSRHSKAKWLWRLSPAARKSIVLLGYALRSFEKALTSQRAQGVEIIRKGIGLHSSNQIRANS